MFGPISATVSLATPAPVRCVWAAFAAVARWPEVLPDLASAHLEPPNELAAGAMIKTIALPGRNFIDMSYAIVATEPNRQLVLQSSAEGFTAQTLYDIAADNPSGGTRAVVTALVTPERLRGRIVSTLWRPKFVEQVERSLRRRTTALLELAEIIANETPS